VNRGAGRAGDAGSVTAELALALPTLIVVLAVGLYALAATSTQGRCADAAAVGARQYARGDDPSAIRERLARSLPPGATVTFGHSEPALVSVQVDVGLPAPAGLHGVVSSVRLHATATAADEAGP
jgi:hypothetical protein